MTTSTSITFKQDSNFSWEALYKLLWHLVKVWVYSARISSWRGQEEEIIEDIVHETIARVYERVQKAERGEANPVNSIENLSKAVARNYLIDLIRKDHRLVRLTQDSHLPGIEHNWIDVSEKVHEAVFRESLFKKLAPEIIKFPKKQKQALLAGLANDIDFSMSSPLQRAFLALGIKLQDYRQPLPDNPAERNRYASLLSIARKRMANLPCVKEYMS